MADIEYKNGSLHVSQIDVSSGLNLSGDAMTEFQQALKDSGFRPGGMNDYSDIITKKGKDPVYIPTPRCAMLNILSDVDLTTLSKAGRGDAVQKVNYDVKVQIEFFDGQGIYFKKWALISAQGNSSMSFKKRNISVKIFDTEDVEGKKKKWGKGDTFGTVFGDWVMQKTYHLKSYYTDFVRGGAIAAYQLADEVYKTRGVYADRPWKKALIDFSKITAQTPANLSIDGINDMNLQIDNGAKCMPDGFPVIVYQQGQFYGIFSWQLKKDPDNFNLNTSVAEHIHIDGDLYASNIWGGTVNWTAFEIRNPEDLICMDGSDYDGDHPSEIISPTMIVEGVEVDNPYYDPTDENHVKTWEVKQYIISLSGRVGEINSFASSLEIPTPRQEYPIMHLGEFKGFYKDTTSYGRSEWVYDESTEHYYLSLHSSNVGHIITDPEYWLNIDEYINQIKNLIETYFDSDNLIDYQLINMAVGDTDGFGKNWQWVTYDGVKWWVNQYDKDMSFGNYFTGMFTTFPRIGWLGNTITLPSGIALKYYQPEHKIRWNELIDNGIFNSKHIEDLISGWVNRIGKINFEKEWGKWPEAPCNRSSRIDFENWEFTGNASSSTPSSGIIWDSETSYDINTEVWFKIFDGNWHLKFKAIKNNLNKPCLTGSYNDYPKSMGYRDSIWRFFKYVELTIENQNSFIRNL